MDRSLLSLSDVYPSPEAGGWWCARAPRKVRGDDEPGNSYWIFTPDGDRVATVWARGDGPDHARRHARLIVDALNAAERPSSPPPEPDRRS